MWHHYICHLAHRTRPPAANSKGEQFSFLFFGGNFAMFVLSNPQWSYGYQWTEKYQSCLEWCRLSKLSCNFSIYSRSNMQSRNYPQFWQSEGPEMTWFSPTLTKLASVSDLIRIKGHMMASWVAGTTRHHWHHYICPLAHRTQTIHAIVKVKNQIFCTLKICRFVFFWKFHHVRSIKFTVVIWVSVDREISELSRMVPFAKIVM